MEINIPPSPQEESIPLGVFLALGNPILDILAEVPLARFRHYVVQENSAILAEEHHFPIYNELVENFSDTTYLASGSAQNTARVTQWMLSVPNSAAYMGCIGCDSYGSQLKACIAGAGVTAHYMEDPTTSTGKCAVLLHRGARTLIANLGASTNFNASHLLTDKSKQLMETALYVYIPCFFLTSSVDSLLLVARETVSAGKIFMLNLSATFLIEFFQDQMHHAISYCDFLFGSAGEARLFGKLKGWGNDVKQVALKLAAMPKASGTRPRIVVITQAGHWAARTVIQHSGCSFPKRCDYKF